jgi:hypothetical protein
MVDVGPEKAVHTEKLAQYMPKTTASLQEHLVRITKLRHNFPQSEFAGSTLPVGVVDLGRDRQRLSGLRLAAKSDLASGRWRIDDRGFHFRWQCAADVANLHRGNVRRLLAGKTGVLKFNSGRVGTPSLSKLSSFWQCARACIDRILAEQLFDAQELIVFGRAVGAAQ